MTLRLLEIESFGLIERASLDFASGLTMCTGETGSGKTMVLDALAFALGDRTSADVVRRGANAARVTLTFEPDEETYARFARDGFEIDPDEVAVFSREVAAGGKSSARINGRPASATQLREYASTIVDRIGQHEQQRLLARSYHLTLLDRFAGDDALALRQRAAAAHERFVSLESERDGFAAEIERARAEADFAAFALGEIDAAALRPGEERELRERRDVLSNAERIAAALAGAHEALAGGEGSALDLLGNAAAALAPIARYSERLGALAEQVAASQSEVGDAAAAIAREVDGVESQPTELEGIVERLDTIDRLKKKYGGDADAVIAARDAFARTLETVSTSDERRAELARALELARSERADIAGRLTQKRGTAARALEKAVMGELRALGMPSARFAVEAAPLSEPGPAGAETIEFFLSPNAGEDVRPLARAASGGELSRVLLALVVATADRRDASALVFDEIDAGIGGATAAAVGRRLAQLARTTQVVCVTHLAQIAAFGQAHVALRKRERRGETTIELEALEGDEPVLRELARMLSGTEDSVALAHARELLATARDRKAVRA